MKELTIAAKPPSLLNDERALRAPARSGALDRRVL